MLNLESFSGTLLNAFQESNAKCSSWRGLPRAMLTCIRGVLKKFLDTHRKSALFENQIVTFFQRTLQHYQCICASTETTFERFDQAGLCCSKWTLPNIFSGVKSDAPQLELEVWEHKKVTGGQVRVVGWVIQLLSALCGQDVHSCSHLVSRRVVLMQNKAAVSLDGVLLLHLAPSADSESRTDPRSRCAVLSDTVAKWPDPLTKTVIICLVTAHDLPNFCGGFSSNIHCAADCCLVSAETLPSAAWRSPGHSHPLVNAPAASSHQWLPKQADLSVANQKTVSSKLLEPIKDGCLWWRLNGKCNCWSFVAAATHFWSRTKSWHGSVCSAGP